MSLTSLERINSTERGIIVAAAVVVISLRRRGFCGGRCSSRILDDRRSITSLGRRSLGSKLTLLTIVLFEETVVTGHARLFSAPNLLLVLFVVVVGLLLLLFRSSLFLNHCCH